MNPDSQPSRANEVWRRFTGLFGGDAVERKFGKTPPAEWASVIGKLKDYELERGMRRLVHSGRDAVPSLPAFTKLCRTIQDDSIDEGPRALALPSPDSRQFDRWAIAANNRLLGYVMRQGVERRYYNADETGVLVGYKNAWATDMREAIVHPETGEIVDYSPAIQQEQWDECMRRAEERIHEMRRSKAA